jgi:hypothetical protein
MSIKDSFSQEEWNLVLQSPLVAGFAVTAADPGGLIGAVQEATAMAKSLKGASDDAAEGSLIAEITASIQSPEGRQSAQTGLKSLIKGYKPAEASAAAVAQLKEVMSIVHAKAPGEAAALSGLIRETARKVAEAANEGTFLGFGGEQISEAEHQTLADIDAALGTAAA